MAYINLVSYTCLDRNLGCIAIFYVAKHCELSIVNKLLLLLLLLLLL